MDGGGEESKPKYGAQAGNLWFIMLLQLPASTEGSWQWACDFSGEFIEVSACWEHRRSQIARSEVVSDREEQPRWAGNDIDQEQQAEKCLK